MTRDQWIDKYRHEFGGMLLDAVCNDRRGSELSIFIRNLQRKVDKALAEAHDALQPTNGKPINEDSKRGVTR